MEISNEICRILEHEDLIVEQLDLINTIKYPIIDNYDGIIVGTGIRIGRWTKEAKKFLTKIDRVLDRNNQYLGVYASSLLASDPSLYEDSKQDFVVSILDELGVKPDLIDIFGGIFDLSKSSQKSWYEKMLVKRVLNRKKYENTILPSFKENVNNDFRDWNQIGSFARKFASLLQKLTKKYDSKYVN